MEFGKTFTLLLMSLIVQLASTQTDSLPTENPAVEPRRIVKRNDLKAILARSMDPNFWAMRGKKRSDHELDHQKDGSPGRKINEEDLGVYLSGRFKNLEDDPLSAFWASRGSGLDDDMNWAGKSHTYEDPSAELWAGLLGKERRIGDYLPDALWPGQGRSLDIDLNDFFSTKKDRRSEDESIDKYWNSLGESHENFPNEALHNRGKPEEENEVPDDDPEKDIRWRRHQLFVEEPGWVSLDRRGAQPVYEISFLGGSNPPTESGNFFWVSRGKKHRKVKREIRPDLSCESFHPKRNSKDIIRELTMRNQNHFWAARGKRPILDYKEVEKREAETSPRKKKEAPNSI